MPNRYSTPRVKGGTQTLGIEIEGMDRVKVAINGLDHALSDLRPLWPLWRDAFYRSTKDAFSSESSGDGAWAPLSTKSSGGWPSYADWKAEKYPGRGLLVLTGDLQQSLTGPGKGNVYRPAAQSMEIGSSVPYATYHQSGTDKMPARPPIAPTKEGQRIYGEAMAAVGRKLQALWAKGHR